MLIVPEFEAVCKRMAPLLPRIYSAVDHGTAEVCEFFKKKLPEKLIFILLPLWFDTSH